MISKGTLVVILIFSIFCINLISYNGNYKSLDNDKKSENKRYTVSSDDTARYGAGALTTDNNAFLPGTNLSISEYLDGYFQNTYNTTILSINNSHIDVRCDYSRTKDIYGDPFSSRFYSTISRTGINHSYSVSNYYNWYGLAQDSFEFWIDTTGFEDGYIYYSEGVEITVSRENISLNGVGYFEAWKISAIIPEYFVPFSAWYAQSGLFLSLTYEFVSTFWYNLTLAELNKIPEEYTGPSLTHIFPNNGSILPSGTLIDLEFTSPYGIYTIYYKWDNAVNSTIFSPLPSDDGTHDLYVTPVDNLGYSPMYYLVFITDDNLPGIELVNIENMSKIQGSRQIEVSITSSNGSIIYYWDGAISNTTITEGTLIQIDNSSVEGVRTLKVFVKSPAGIWTRKRFIFTVDNTPPTLTVYCENKSVVRGKMTFNVSVLEDSIINYIIPGVISSEFSAIKNQNYSISLLDLDNGSYQLFLKATDLANNSNQIVILFDVHTSSFDWNWVLEADSERTIDFIDEYAELWFKLSIASKSSQSLQLSVLSEDSLPSRENDLLYVIELSCDSPTDILFMTLIFPLKNLDLDSNSSFEVYEWTYWNSTRNEWNRLLTSFNEVSHSWEATFEGSLQYFALRKTGETTYKKSVIVGGGQIPSFDWLITIFTLSLVSLVAFFRRSYTKRRT